jgi:hypothetical protein
MRVARKAQAVQFAANVLPIIRDIQAAGHNSLNGIGKRLFWQPKSVQNCQLRCSSARGQIKDHGGVGY